MSLYFIVLIDYIKKKFIKKIFSSFFKGVSLSFYIVVAYTLKNNGLLNFISVLELITIFFIIIIIFHYYVYKTIFSNYYSRTKLSYAYVNMEGCPNKLYIYNNISGNFLCSNNDYMKCGKYEKIKFDYKILEVKNMIIAYLKKYKKILLYLDNMIIKNEYNKYNNKILPYIKIKKLGIFRYLYKSIVFKMSFSKEQKKIFEKYYISHYDGTSEEVSEINKGICKTNETLVG